MCLLQMKYAAIKMRITIKRGMITATAMISGAVPPESPLAIEVVSIVEEVAVVVLVVDVVVVVVLLKLTGGC